MIRHCIICDICGVERKQANHWFAAQQQGGEIRMSAFIPSKSMRPGLKHLCGQTCLHRLVDEYLAGSMGARLPGMQVEERIYQKSPSVSPDTPNEPDSPENAFSARVADSSLYSRKSSFDEDVALDFESSARVIPYAPKTASERKLEDSPARVVSSLSVKAEKKIPRAPALAKPGNGASLATSRSGSAGNEPTPLAGTGDISGQDELERRLSASVPSPKAPPKPRSAPAPELSTESHLPAAFPPGTTPTVAGGSPSEGHLVSGKSLSDPTRLAIPNLPAPNSPAPAAIPAAKKLLATLTPPQTPLSQRSVAGAWERARLWESQSAHQRQTTGKKAQSL